MSQPAGQRRVPRQSRSKVTVARIQQATLEVLEQEGLDGLNTNAIAERAGVNIATLYSYFRDKYDILYDLFEISENQRAEAVLAQIDALRNSEDWRAWMRSIIQKMADLRAEQPGGVVLRSALAFRPELLDLDDRSTVRSAQAVAEALTERTPGLDEERARCMAKVTVTTITHLLDLAFSQAPPDRAIVEELKDLIVRYLEPHIGAQKENAN